MDERTVKHCVDARAVWLAEALAGALDRDREPACYEAYVSSWSSLGCEERGLALALTRHGPMPYGAGGPG